MKIKSYILSLGVITVLLSSSTFAATINTTPSTKKSIILNNQSYTLNVCDAKEVDALRLKVIVGLKGKPLASKRRIYTQLRLLQAAWIRTCPDQQISSTKPITVSDPNFTIITNPTYINSLSLSQKNTSIERANLYRKSAESIIDNMVTHGILNSTDKANIKGKIELNYVDDCKKIDGLTTVKQWYDSNKKRVKNELVSISLNVSTCEEANFKSLFATSYKHVFIHEVGHYIYYLKDTNTKKFEDICRDSNEKRKPGCLSYDTFYSKYATNDPQEDYAETFAYWFQAINPEFDIQGIRNDLATLRLKAQHFSDMYKK